jgi:hypothetical protein
MAQFKYPGRMAWNPSGWWSGMNLNERGVFCLLFVLLGLGVFWVWTSHASSPAIDSLLSDNWETLNQNLFDTVDTKVYHNCPDHMIAEPTYTRHRYPRYAGHNFSLLIHRGFAPLMECAGRDPQWLDNPPQNMGGYSI